MWPMSGIESMSDAQVNRGMLVFLRAQNSRIWCAVPVEDDLRIERVKNLWKDDRFWQHSKAQASVSCSH